MTHPVDRTAIEAEQRAERAREEFIRKQLQADVQQVMNLPGMRRILFLFQQWAGVDDSPFATNAMHQSFNIGKADAGRWWMNLVRQYCPEKEMQIRREGDAMAKPATNEEEPE